MGTARAIDFPLTATRRAGGVQAAVAIDDVTMRFDDQLALDRVSLSVPSGTILGMIGPSGAGKTTTIRLLTGTLAPTSGSVVVLGENPRRFTQTTRMRIGYMPQALTLFPDLTARENVDLAASLFGMLFRSRRRRTREVLELVDLWGARGRRASQLSGGMQRRLELACALVHDPSLLFLDEPTASIDPLLRERIWQELHRLRRDGRTLVVTTQYVNEAEACDTVALITEGQLIALATPDELRRQAMGGDIIEIETAAIFDATQLSDLPFIREARQLGPRHLRVAVDDAGSAIPDVVEAVERHDGEVTSAREERPTFDEVFARLVERHRRVRTESDAESGSGSDR
ncbi:MAG TPA: ABC transporter ATP-binding protein [Candidatus Limnocylindrales bacterium]|nr:ABC transporter ATP-binding protein [Candidatus Limnocylindrales bacterium]